MTTPPQRVMARDSSAASTHNPPPMLALSMNQEFMDTTAACSRALGAARRAVPGPCLARCLLGNRTEQVPFPMVRRMRSEAAGLGRPAPPKRNPGGRRIRCSH